MPFGPVLWCVAFVGKSCWDPSVAWLGVPQVVRVVFPSTASVTPQQPRWVSSGTGIVPAQRGKAGQDAFLSKPHYSNSSSSSKNQNVKKQHGSSISGLLGEMLKVGSEASSFCNTGKPWVGCALMDSPG